MVLAATAAFESRIVSPSPSHHTLSLMPLEGFDLQDSSPCVQMIVLEHASIRRGTGFLSGLPMLMKSPVGASKTRVVELSPSIAKGKIRRAGDGSCGSLLSAICSAAGMARSLFEEMLVAGQASSVLMTEVRANAWQP